LLTADTKSHKVYTTNIDFLFVFRRFLSPSARLDALSRRCIFVP